MRETPKPVEGSRVKVCDCFCPTCCFDVYPGVFPRCVCVCVCACVCFGELRACCVRVFGRECRWVAMMHPKHLRNHCTGGKSRSVRASDWHRLYWQQQANK